MKNIWFRFITPLVLMAWSVNAQAQASAALPQLKALADFPAGIALNVGNDAQRGGIRLWGLQDSESWLANGKTPSDGPLLFDENMQAKPVFWGVVQGLRGI
ncbi:endo-1,4-beta-xylanase [Undibacterium sp. TS12]|uniref:endo-1,4-beta-xylanase n=1 Tax=Undibacterium sp. TS12 TaxID=2908202 RepID=UPI001F4D140E|nr:endo-1,4-beta-xylanase [Undibacterium sp. TS12]MCH8619713.1 endo-1,4-beta-xylanase [Undibacterium sp. TS12]